MKQIPTIFISLFIAIISCDTPRDSKPLTQDTPKALQEGRLTEVSSSGRSGDLIDNIYAELLDKSPELKEIENKILKIQRSKNESLSLFHEYDGKNDQFYSSADSHLSQITDSVLRQQIKALLITSARNYKNSTERHNDLLKTVNINADNLRNVHIILKLYKTLLVIEEYQKTYLPSTTPIQNLINDYDKTIKRIESQTKKQNGG